MVRAVFGTFNKIIKPCHFLALPRSFNSETSFVHKKEPSQGRLNKRGGQFTEHLFRFSYSLLSKLSQAYTNLGG
jgi:hypothetical protein